MSHNDITMPVFNELLEPRNIAPALDFHDSGTLVCADVPEIELRAKIRFLLDEEVNFSLGSGDEVKRLMRHWRAELSPEIGSTEDIFVSGFEDDEELTDLASEAPIIRLVNHLFARALDYRVPSGQGEYGRTNQQRHGAIGSDVHVPRGCEQKIGQRRDDRTVNPGYRPKPRQFRIGQGRGKQNQADHQACEHIRAEVVFLVGG